MPVTWVCKCGSVGRRPYDHPPFGPMEKHLNYYCPWLGLPIFVAWEERPKPGRAATEWFVQRRGGPGEGRRDRPSL